MILGGLGRLGGRAGLYPIRHPLHERKNLPSLLIALALPQEDLFCFYRGKKVSQFRCGTDKLLSMATRSLA